MAGVIANSQGGIVSRAKVSPTPSRRDGHVLIALVAILKSLNVENLSGFRPIALRLLDIRNQDQSMDQLMHCALRAVRFRVHRRGVDR